MAVTKEIPIWDLSPPRAHPGGALVLRGSTFASPTSIREGAVVEVGVTEGELVLILRHAYPASTGGGTASLALPIRQIEALLAALRG